MSDFPTITAITIARHAGLYPVTASMDIHGLDDAAVKKRDRAEKFENLLSEFQQMSVFNNFEDSFEIYSNLKLSETQIEALGKIHKITKPWIKGKLAGVLVRTLEQSEPKDVPNVVKSLVENMNSSTISMEGVKKWKINLNHKNSAEKEETNNATA